MMIADLMEKLEDRGFATRVTIGTELIGIVGHKSGVSIEVLGSENINVLKDRGAELTEFRGSKALLEALNFAG